MIGDRKIPTKPKVKLHTSIVRSVLIYRAECWVTGTKEEGILEATEMRMLRRIQGVTLKDRKRSED